MSDGQRTAYPARGVPELQAVLLAVGVVVVGPPALILGVLLAELAGR